MSKATHFLLLLCLWKSTLPADQVAEQLKQQAVGVIANKVAYYFLAQPTPKVDVTQTHSDMEFHKVIGQIAPRDERTQNLLEAQFSFLQETEPIFFKQLATAYWMLKKEQSEHSCQPIEPLLTDLVNSEVFHESISEKLKWLRDNSKHRNAFVATEWPPFEDGKVLKLFDLTFEQQHKLFLKAQLFENPILKK